MEVQDVSFRGNGKEDFERMIRVEQDVKQMKELLQEMKITLEKKVVPREEIYSMFNLRDERIAALEKDLKEVKDKNITKLESNQIWMARLVVGGFVGGSVTGVVALAFWVIKGGMN